MLHGFIACNDGRLYHPVICEIAKKRFEQLKGRQRGAALLSVILVFDGVACALFDGSIGADRLPDATERAAVLAAVKDAARR